MDLTVAHGLWFSEAHSRYERFHISRVLGIPAGMLGVDNVYTRGTNARVVGGNRELLPRGAAPAEAAEAPAAAPADDDAAPAAVETPQPAHQSAASNILAIVRRNAVLRRSLRSPGSPLAFGSPSA